MGIKITLHMFRNGDARCINPLRLGPAAWVHVKDFIGIHHIFHGNAIGSEQIGSASKGLRILFQ